MAKDLTADIREQIATIGKEIAAQKDIIKSSMNDPVAMEEAVRHLRELIVRSGLLERNLRAATEGRGAASTNS